MCAVHLASCFRLPRFVTHYQTSDFPTTSEIPIRLATHRFWGSLLGIRDSRFGFGVGVAGLGSRGWCFGVEVSHFGVWTSGVPGSGLKIQASGLPGFRFRGQFRVQSSKFRAVGLGFRD